MSASLVGSEMCIRDRFCTIMHYFCIEQFPAVSCAGGLPRPPGAGSCCGAAAPVAQETAGNCTMQNSAE
eukprot:10454881-Alexandrium_andersonii.AAC.1